MATDFKSLPLIDISPLVAKWDDSNMAEDDGVAKVVRQLDQACRESGFFYVKGHGIPDSLLKEIRNVACRFFNLPYEEKINIKMSAKTGYRFASINRMLRLLSILCQLGSIYDLSQNPLPLSFNYEVTFKSRGYQRIGENITKGKLDMHEAIDCIREVKGEMYGALGKPLEGSNEWPIDPPNLRQLVEEYISLCTDLSRKIMRGIALALGGSMDEFEGDIAGDPFWALRMIGYPGVSFANCQDMPKNEIGCGAHTDYGLLTLVNQDDEVTALQVRNLSGEWILAVPIPGTFVCNVGDMLKLLSNGHYESTLHRVINNSPKYRVCLAYFYEPNFETTLEPLDICVQRTGGRKKFEGAVYGEHLVSKLLTNFVM